MNPASARCRSSAWQCSRRLRGSSRTGAGERVVEVEVGGRRAWGVGRPTRGVAGANASSSSCRAQRRVVRPTWRRRAEPARERANGRSATPPNSDVHVLEHARRADPAAAVRPGGARRRTAGARTRRGRASGGRGMHRHGRTASGGLGEERRSASRRPPTRQLDAPARRAPRTPRPVVAASRAGRDPERRRLPRLPPVADPREVRRVRGEDVDERVAAELVERRPGELERDGCLRDDRERLDGLDVRALDERARRLARRRDRPSRAGA